MAVNFHNPVHLVLMTVLLISVFQLASCDDQSQALVKNKPAPGFSLQNMQGQVVDFPGQFNNQVVIVSFWADWCPSCYKEMHDFETLYQRYKNQGVSIVAINIEQDKKTALAFIDGLNLSYELLLDSNGGIAKKYSVSSLPAAFIINKDGTLHTRVLGETPPQVFDEILRKLL